MFEWILRCRAGSATQQRTGHLQAGISLTFAVLALSVAACFAFVGGYARTGLVIGVAGSSFLVLYLMNRQGWITAAGVALIGVIMLALFGATLTSDTSPLSAVLLPTVLSVPIALTGALLDWRMVPGVTALAIVEALVLYNSSVVASAYGGHPDFLVAQFLISVVLIAGGVLSTFFSFQVAYQLQQLQAQNAALSEQSARERGLIAQMQVTAIQLSQSATEIAGAAAQQASGSNEQAAAIVQVTSTVEELNQTGAQIAEAASSVAEAAAQALTSANRGQEAVRDSVLGMAVIKARVNDITTRILTLSEQSQRISEVIDLINTIAAQTHILALNAAVESAGAGEAGVRFGVVAAEVKKLAQRSVAATKEVRLIIGQIQAATAAAVMATEEGLKETDKGVILAHQSGDANEDIISMVERTAQLAAAISLALQHQRTANEQVANTMREVADVTQQAALSSRQTMQAVNELSQVAHNLSHGRPRETDPPIAAPDERLAPALA